MFSLLCRLVPEYGYYKMSVHLTFPNDNITQHKKRIRYKSLKNLARSRVTVTGVSATTCSGQDNATPERRRNIFFCRQKKG